MDNGNTTTNGDTAAMRTTGQENGTELRARGTPNDNNHQYNSKTTEENVTVDMIEEQKKFPATPSRLSTFKSQCKTMTKPCLLKHNPLPENASVARRIKQGFLWPPHGRVAQYVQFTLLSLQIWAVLIALTKDQALPGGNFFSLLILFVACVIGGYLTAFTKLPPLLGMLIMGVLLRNIPGIKAVGEHIDVGWSGALRKLALTVILTRAGLGLDPVKLKKLSFAVLRLAFLPCLAEAITSAIVSHYLLNFPWTWSLVLGCIMAALSPAVTVPSLVSLQDRKYGVAKGIPTMGLAAGGLDNVACITGFAVFLGIIFSDGSLAVTIVKGPLGALVGIAYGFVMGFILWYLPAKDSDNPLFYRCLMLLGSGMIAIFGSSAVGLSGAGPLGCLTTATVAAYRWRKMRQPGEPDELAAVMAIAWLIVQHFLFGLIGAAVDISDIQGNTAGLGIATLAIGLCVRSMVSFTVTLGTGFNLKERLFITLTWLSKATVQAAIGGMALDRAREADNPDPEEIKMGTDVLTISVLAIIICAPTGATLMGLLGPKFLAKGDEETDTCGKDVEKPSTVKPSSSQAEMKATSAPQLKTTKNTAANDVIVPQASTAVKAMPPQKKEASATREVNKMGAGNKNAMGNTTAVVVTTENELGEDEDDRPEKFSSEVTLTLKVDDSNKVRVDSINDNTGDTNTAADDKIQSKAAENAPCVSVITVTNEA